ncbi:DUF6355 family natural product biosynthesis protein [Lentzea cavernae]|uniref:Secreted protein n=1 Tax=Lentzea cavernae TaxID=2020703 RepID=A0ABQ3MW73_9PSEU|nr:DUF6355 family natural product biosynthesis protein [Lentzea cavernae]GHH62454.1 hypothetical protein GCM10017774_90240 [Lentzea cavernae]
MSSRLTNVLCAVGMFLGTAMSSAPDANAHARIVPAPGCGFIPLPQPVGELTARYYHCADSFILIKYHWSGGNTRTTCVSPWGQVPFFRLVGQVVVNAYYVTTPPKLSGPPGNQMCSHYQPIV